RARPADHGRDFSGAPSRTTVSSTGHRDPSASRERTVMARTPASSDPYRPDPSPGDDPRNPEPDASAGDRPVAGREPAGQQQVGTDPALDEHQRQGISGAMWTALILGLLILILLLVFILQNNVPAD